MDWLYLLFGSVGVVSFIFSIYVYFKNESGKVVEAAKNAMHKERLRNTQYAISNLLRIIDGIVQIPKMGNVRVDQLQEIGRLARAEAIILARQLELDIENTEHWRYGKLVDSDPGNLSDIEDRENI